MQHQAGFGQGGVQPLAAFGFWDQIADALHAAPHKAGQYPQGWHLAAQLAGSRLQQRNLAAVAVEEHQALKSRSRQLLANGHDLGDQQLRRQGEGARKPSVLWRKSKALQGQPPDRKIRVQSLQHRLH